jgi:hypothetical protein
MYLSHLTHSISFSAASYIKGIQINEEGKNLKITANAKK